MDKLDVRESTSTTIIYFEDTARRSIQCRELVISTPCAHWPECLSGSNQKEAQAQVIRSVANSLVDVAQCPEVLDPPRNEAVCALYLRNTHERSRRNL